MVWPQCCHVCKSDDKVQVDVGQRTDTFPRVASKNRRPTASKDPSRKNIGLLAIRESSFFDKDASTGSRSLFETGTVVDVGDGATPRAETPSDKPPGSASSKCSADALEDADGLMPFRKQKTSADDRLARRRSVNCMEVYLEDGAHRDGQAGKTQNAAVAEAAPGDQAVTITVGSSVVRGPDWKWGQEDGGAGLVGRVLAINSEEQTVTVRWASSARTLSHYRCGRCNDLSPATGTSAESAADSIPASQAEAKFSELRRMNTAKELFADPEQTIIIFDWDDTLFPTTFVRDDLHLDWRTPLRLQPLAQREKAEISRLLAKCAENASASLRTASQLGKVVLVTLARSPWVRDSCTNFFPKIGALISQLQIPVIYAQEGQQVEYDKSKMTSSEDIEAFWSRVKSKAIAAEIKSFYSRYEGQSWKNVISIGDSDFERLGTQQATMEYLKQAGIGNQGGILRQKTCVVGGHVYKVRTKTFKMLDQPTVEELTVELAMIQQWLAPLVKLDDSCDINLSDLEDPKSLQRIERTLRGHG